MIKGADCVFNVPEVLSNFDHGLTGGQYVAQRWQYSRKRSQQHRLPTIAKTNPDNLSWDAAFPAGKRNNTSTPLLHALPEGHHDWTRTSARTLLIEAYEFSSAGLKVTICGGITEYTREKSATLIERRKSLLINARKAGHNRFCLDTDIV